MRLGSGWTVPQEAQALRLGLSGTLTMTRTTGELSECWGKLERPPLLVRGAQVGVNNSFLGRIYFLRKAIEEEERKVAPVSFAKGKGRRG